ncbi:amino acid adenylation domain-containing protein [Methylosinus sporium]|uniref:Amino acid adenylation domain-containing protein n=1 Tax=Methylosinus sporium TaxID=428 RepID=A0A549T1R2_METSR|nr:non-ribosomal peptide synthetase [Methylosinus sporium]TRL35819.1 amino acid adenylation domain-containing protein [Methylosinus sporium]
MMLNQQTIGYRLSLQQERIWRSWRRSGGDLPLLRGRVRLEGPLDILRLRDSFDRILRRHEALRTRIELLPGTTQPIQIIGEAAALRELRDFGDRAPEERAPTLTNIESEAQFKNLRGAALYAELARFGAGLHYLLIAVSPFCGDGVSLQNIVRELAAGYGGKAEVSSIDEPIQYADYSAWQEDILSADTSDGLRYWRLHEPSVASSAPLALESSLGEEAQFDPAVIKQSLPQEQVRAVLCLARECGVALETVLSASWAALLHRHSVSSDIDLRVLGDGRSDPVATAVGAYSLSLPFHCSFEPGETFATFAKRLQVALDEHRDWQDYAPADTGNVAGAPDRSLGFGYKAMLAPLLAGAVAMTLESTTSLPGQFRLHLQCLEGADQIVAEFHHDRALYSSAAIDCLVEQWTTLLAGASRAPDTSIERLALLGDIERRRLSAEWSAPPTEHFDDGCLHELFQAQLARTPDATAVVFDSGRLTYAELSARANQLAHRLCEFGVGPETIVGVYMERSLEMVIALLGILEAGGAYLPLDPDYPSERLAYMIDDAHPLLVLTREGLRDRVPNAVPTRTLDADWTWSEGGRRDRPLLRVGPQNLAYVIYTSGSTGRPKGVAVSHGAAWRSTSARHRYYAEPVRGFLLLSSFSFDSSVAGLFWTLSQGGRLCLPTDEDLQDVGRLAQLVERHELSHLLCLPSLYAMLLEQHRASLHSLRAAIVAGESCPSSVPILHWARLAETRLYNEYGPTEATVWSTAAELAAQSALRPASIGRPIEGARVILLDERREPVPLGVAGELYIGGVGLARGYLGRADLTAERFVPNPFSKDGERLYRTGDLARYREDGEIEFLGRIDHQVKIRGFRIELCEIEAALTRIPGVRAAVAVAREDVEGDKRLVAYVVGQEGAKPVIADLRAALARALPDYMAPAAFVLLDALPLTSNGKVDRNKLPAPDIEAQAKGRYVAPRTPTEETLCRIWAEALGIERVGVEDNFFELGGHSLLAMTLVERMRQQGLKTDARQLFADPTPAKLAAAVGSNAEVAVPPNLIPAGCDAIVPEMLTLTKLNQADIDRIVGAVPGGASNVQDIYPLAPLQEGILFHHLMATKGDPYLANALLAFDTRSQLEDFVAALRAVVARHDILRTAVAWEGLAEPMQVVWREASMAVEEVSLDPAKGDVAEQLRMRFDPRQYRLDLCRAPLTRGFIARDAGQDRWLLLMLAHHLILDHTTLETCVREARAHFLGHADRLPAPLPFRNFVAQARLGVDRSEHEAFFKAMLGDVTEPTTPFGLLDIQGDGSDIREAQVDLDMALVRRLRDQARAFGVSAASLCHQAWALTLARASGRDDVVFGTVLFGRMHGGEGAERALGLFINTLPLRVRLGAESVADGLRRVHGLLTDLLRHEHASLALAQRCSGVEAPAPLFSALLNFRHGAGVSASGGLMSPWEGVTTLYAEERTNYPLTLSVDEFDEGFRLTAQTQSSLEPERICCFMRVALERLVEALETAPDTAMRSIDVLADAERRRLLVDWNATVAAYPKDRCIHHLFEEQAARTPEAIAVVFESERLTYAELSRRAGRLAHRLCELGVGPETIVGVCMERSMEMVVSLLGILEAGGAYLPLDPDYPGERLAYMVEDARPLLILTQKHLRARLPDAAPTLSLDSGRASIEKASGDRLAARAAPRNLAYVIYTSGSTGWPKGVALEHGGVVNRLEWMQARYGLTPADAVLQKTSFGFDVSVWEFFWPLSVGARLVLAGPADHRDPEALREAIEREGVTTLHFVPSMLQAFLNATDVSAFETVRRVLCSGEALPAGLRDQFHLGWTAELHNLYGPTEASIDVTAYACARSDAETRVPIGRPIWNTQIYLLDKELEPAPLGVAGELYIGGVGLARGYLGRADLTAERFVPNPFGKDGERLYRTGDLARYREDGEIEFLGRIDHQVKIRGFRIELGEIEAALTRIPGVRAAVAVAREDVEGDKRLVAYVVGQEGAKPAVADLRAALARALPDYMAPAAFVSLDALPLTSNGKVDRNKLPAPDIEAQAKGRYVAPRTVTEWIVAREFKEVLQIDPIGVDDNFFHLGGNSLSGVKLVERIRRAVCSSLPVMAIFRAPTVAQLADWISGEKDGERYPLVLMRRGPDASPLYCIHPSGGSLLRYQALVDALGGSRSVYGIQSRSLLDSAYRDNSIEEMAADYVELIRRHQPRGPYFLLGWSMGGFIAASMTALLEEQGEAVAFLGLLDTRPAPDGAQPTALDYVEQFAAIEGKNAEDMLSASDREHLMRMSDRLAGQERYVYAALWGQERGFWRDISSDLADFLYADGENSKRMMRDMRMRSVHSPMHVWWAKQTLDGDSRPPFDWDSRAKGYVTTEIVDGNHHDIVENAHVHAQVRRALQAVSGRSDAGQVPI